MPDPELRRVYVETSTFSYLASRPSRDVRVLARQLVTREWWEWVNAPGGFRVFASSLVAAEAERGDPARARERLALLAPVARLEASDETMELASEYIDAGIVPPGESDDAGHLAFASAYEMDFLVTWNFKHLANAGVRARLALANSRRGLAVPAVCTPEEMLEAMR